MDLLNSALGIHDKALRVRNQRMELLARNIANEDTPQIYAACGRGPRSTLRVLRHGLEAGLEKTRLKKKPAQWVILLFWFFWVFFFYIFAQKREFLGFIQFQEYF